MVKTVFDSLRSLHKEIRYTENLRDFRRIIHLWTGLKYQCSLFLFALLRFLFFIFKRTKMIFKKTLRQTNSNVNIYTNMHSISKNNE